ncbi:hypothetical protein GCM10022243_13280 [Saccharothrix violaceirubra]
MPVGGHDRLQGGSDVAAVGLGQAVRTTPAGSLPANMVPHPREELFSVLVVDDHPLLREAISARLTQMGAGTVHEAASVAEARARALATGPCDLAILDLGLPDGTGIDLVTELRAQGWPRIVVLASSDDPYAVRSAFQAGAQAYLLKSASPMVVTDGVRRVLDGGVYADPSVAPVLAAGTRVPDPSRPAPRHRHAGGTRARGGNTCAGHRQHAAGTVRARGRGAPAGR